MSLDRQTIEKRDFPISRRGYETDAVDEHLARIAQELEQRAADADAPAAAPAAPSLASNASEQVRAIVEAAESTASTIERQAKDDAEQARTAAADDARTTRATAADQAQAHVGAVQEATDLMLKRVEALEAEVVGLLDQLRATAKSVQSDLATLHGQVAEVGGLDRTVSAVAAPVEAPSAAPASPSTPASPTAEAAPVAAATSPAAVTSPAAATSEPAAVPVPSAPEPAAAAPAVETAVPADVPPAAAAPDSAAPELPLDGGAAANRSSDEAGARMVALTMIFDGIPRDQIDRHLAANYDLDDHAAMLDDLYARQG